MITVHRLWISRIVSNLRELFDEWQKISSVPLQTPDLTWKLCAIRTQILYALREVKRYRFARPEVSDNFASETGWVSSVEYDGSHNRFDRAVKIKDFVTLLRSISALCIGVDPDEREIVKLSIPILEELETTQHSNGSINSS